MTDKVAFFYCVGTYAANLEMAKAADLEVTEPGPGDSAVCAGLNGATKRTNGSAPQDPFVGFLDPNIFDAKKVFYPASQQSMGLSIDIGIDNVTKLIKALPKGQRWGLGGYSQGAAVQSGILLKMAAGGELASYASTFIGGVTFGNPRRSTNWRGPVGGTWSGCYDIPGSTTGGHGSFPTTGPYRRLTAADISPFSTRWVEFAYPGDIITSVGDSPLGLGWTSGNERFLTATTLADWVTYIASNLLGAAESGYTMLVPGQVKLNLVDAFGNTFNWLGGGGHVAYPYMPPIDAPAGSPTCYQIALKWLTDKANESATAPILMPPTSTAGWSTTLVPPAA